jgi:hypothetical protein
MGPFCILGVLDDDENCCSTKRASVLIRSGAAAKPEGLKQPKGCFK